MPPTKWRKSSYSQSPTSDCVEVALGQVGAAVRDSKNSSGPVLRFGTPAWRELLSAMGT
jgi:hypothetical protein